LIRERAIKEWGIHKWFSRLFMGVLFISLLVCAAIAMRFLKPPAVIGALVTMTLIQILLFLNAGRVVISLMKCRLPNEQEFSRLQPILDRLLLRANLKHAPILFVSDMEKPNAFAFGSGVMGGWGVAVTGPMLTLLEDAELEAVLAHELGHLRSRDTALMTVISISLTTISRFSKYLVHIGRFAFIVALLTELVSYIPRVIAAAIAQLREYAADAFSVYLTGETKHLISAFEKMRTWKQVEEPKKDHPFTLPQWQPMDELLLSHPDMKNRITLLRKLEIQEGENHESI